MHWFKWSIWVIPIFIITVLLGHLASAGLVLRMPELMILWLGIAISIFWVLSVIWSKRLHVQHVRALLLIFGLHLLFSGLITNIFWLQLPTVRLFDYLNIFALLMLQALLALLSLFRTKQHKQVPAPQKQTQVH